MSNAVADMITAIQKDHTDIAKVDRDLASRLSRIPEAEFCDVPSSEMRKPTEGELHLIAAAFPATFVLLDPVSLCVVGKPLAGLADALLPF